MNDYTISWAYIVNRMEERYGMSPNNEEKMSFGDIEKYLSEIWVEYYDTKSHDTVINSIKSTFNTFDATQHTECVENALDALDEAQRAYEQGVKDTLDKYDETCRIASEIRMAVGCKTVKECRELIRNGEIQRVKPGKWIINERGVYECSVCGLVPTQEQKQYDRYCPNCGASMEGDVE